MKLDKFTAAYIRTAFWSSNEYAFGKCPCCNQGRILCKYHPEEETEVCEKCASVDADPSPMEDNYSASDLAPETLSTIIADCERFQRENVETLSDAIASGKMKCGPDFDETERAGHDFWLTRNGHGAGFWDGDWPEPQAQLLTDASKAFGECNLYVGDDGKIYL